MPALTLRDRLREALARKFCLDEAALAEQIAHVVRGEEVHDDLHSDAHGHLHLVGRRVVRRPADMARGLVVYDRLLGGELGFTNQQMDEKLDLGRLYGQFAPPVDERVVYSPLEPVPVVLHEADKTTTGG